MRVGIGVIQNMNRKTRLRLPRKCFDQPITLHGDGRIAIHEPSHGVLQKPAQIGVAGSPRGPIDVAREINQTAAAALFYDHGWLICSRYRWIRKLGWISRVRRHNRKHGTIDWCYRQAEFGAWNPIRIGKAVENRMGAFDPRKKSVSARGNRIAFALDAKNRR